MGRYSFLPHTADLRLFVEASTHEELFRLALEGMNRIMHTHYEQALRNTKTTRHTLSLCSSDISSLLIDFLSEVLTLSHIHKALYHTLESLSLHETALDATLLSQPIIHIEKEIKAVSYHGANVSRDTQGLFYTTIIFDI